MIVVVWYAFRDRRLGLAWKSCGPVGMSGCGPLSLLEICLVVVLCQAILWDLWEQSFFLTYMFNCVNVFIL